MGYLKRSKIISVANSYLRQRELNVFNSPLIQKVINRDDWKSDDWKSDDWKSDELNDDGLKDIIKRTKRMIIKRLGLDNFSII